MLFQGDEALVALDAAEEVARAGASELRRWFRRLPAGAVDEKARHDLVSTADRASEAAILEAIRHRFPTHRVLSEEAGAVGDGDGPTWVVDPLDGTTNFVHGFPHCAVSVAVVEDGRAQVGVVLDPFRDDVFRAARGHGAWWNGRRVRVSERDRLDLALLTTGFPFRSMHCLEPYLAILRDLLPRCQGVRRPGSAALDLAHVACGIFDGFFEYALSPWDVAAGIVLVEEAGGVVTDLAGGGEVLLSGDVLAATPAVHRELLEVVRRHG